MVEHSVDLLAAAWWLIVVIGGVLISLLIYGGKLVLGRLDRHDAAFEAIKQLLASEVKALREMQHDMDVRLTKIETACSYMHPNGDQHRRTTD